METSYDSIVRPQQEKIFNAVVEFNKTDNPLALRDISKDVASKSKVDGNALAKHIQNFYRDRGDGAKFLSTKSFEELKAFHTGLVKVKLTDPSSAKELAGVLDQVTSAAQKYTEKPASVQNQERVERSAKSAGKKHPKSKATASTAARVSVAAPQSQTREETISSLLSWAQKYAKSKNHQFSQSDLSKLRIHASSNVDSPDRFKLMVQNMVSIVDHDETKVRGRHDK